MNIVDRVPGMQSILSHVMLAFGLYPETIPEEDIRYLAFYGGSDYTNAINKIPDARVKAILENRVDLPEAQSNEIVEHVNPLDDPNVVNPLTNYFIDYRLLHVYLATCIEIQKYIPGFLNQVANSFILQTDINVVNNFITKLKQVDLFARQFLALMLVTGRGIAEQNLITLRHYCDTNVRPLCGIVSEVPPAKIEACTTKIKQVLDEYQSEKEKIKQFLHCHVKTDQISKLYIQLWCQSPQLLNTLNRNQPEDLEDMINFRLFFAENRRYCRELLHVIRDYIDDREVQELLTIVASVRPLVSCVTFTSDAKMQNLIWQIQSLTDTGIYRYNKNIPTSPITDKQEFDMICWQAQIDDDPFGLHRKETVPIPDDEGIKDIAAPIVPVVVKAEIAPKIPIPEAMVEMEVNGNEKACTICFERAVNTVIVPCGHSMLCVTCARNYVLEEAKTICPGCRLPMQQIVRVFNLA